MIDNDIDSVLNSSPDVELELDGTKDEKVDTPVEYRTGAAGTGKTFSVRAQIEQDPKWALLCATTGIAAVNLGTTTLHSTLGLRPDVLEDQFTSGYMRQRMHVVARQYRNLVIDEVSMLSATFLDMLYTTAEQVNEFKDVAHAFGLILVGDFCQLPPINEPWAFDAQCWPRFEAATTRLTKNYRQGNGTFLDALNFLRSGRGAEAAKALAASGAHMVRNLDPAFDGTVILGRNAEVDNYNQLRYWKLKGHEFTYRATRWGKQRSEWKNVPDTLRLKVGSYVMILANDTERDLITHEPLFRFVNGDCGHIVDTSIKPPKPANDDGEIVEDFLDENEPAMGIQLVRTGQVVDIEMVTRDFKHKNAPEDLSDDEIERAKKSPRLRLPDGTYYDKGFWYRGGITYMPLRLAYATTVHKSQGLTLDRIQVDLRHNFLGEPAMSYVAMSRCRTADGLHVVGDARMIERRCRIDEKVRRWL